jgi:LmbE family N-acetylglucosaminyl deacetylase
MSQPIKLMCALAHPDDESLGTGGILAKYAADGVHTYLITATRGERGWFGDPEDYPGPQSLARIREEELYAAAQALGIQEVEILGYHDGELDQADPEEVIGKLIRHLRRVQPHVVVTFGPDGIYGHPDHIAISQYTTAAVVAAADPSFVIDGNSTPHRVSKLYYAVSTQEDMAAYQQVFGELVLNIDGEERRVTSWQPWAITTWVDVADYWPQVWQAISCHRSQLPGYQKLQNLPSELHRSLWEHQTFYRAYSLVNGGRGIEKDLLAGLH